MNDKLSEYKSRYKEWQNISISQLSITNNLLLTISIAYSGYIFEKGINQCDRFNLIYQFSLILSFLSMFFGVVVLFSRMFDFRFSRKIAHTRFRIYKKYKKRLKEKNNRQIKRLGIIEIFKLIFLSRKDLEEVSEKCYKRDTLTFYKNLENLVYLTDRLGATTWYYLSLQIVFLMLSILFFLMCEMY